MKPQCAQPGPSPEVAVVGMSQAKEELHTSLKHCRACEQTMEQHDASMQAEVMLGAAEDGVHTQHRG